LNHKNTKHNNRLTIQANNSQINHSQLDTSQTGSNSTSNCKKRLFGDKINAIGFNVMPSTVSNLYLQHTCEPCQQTAAFLPLNTTPGLTSTERIRRFLHLLSYQSGISSLYARLKQESVATILMYHSIPTEQETQWMDPYNCLSTKKFEKQMKFLAQHRQVISIEQLTQQLEKGEPIRRGTVVITFDDGYRNNLTIAAPILAKYNLPATIYLATGYIDTKQNQWIDTLYSAFRTASKHQLNLLSWEDKRLKNWNLEESNQREQAYYDIADYLIEADTVQRQDLLNEIDQQLSPTAYPPRLTLTWDEVRQLQQQYANITLGVHTSNHLDLSTHSEKTAQEMELSIEHMATATGVRPKHLSFPYNRYNAQAQAQVVAAQLSSAVAVASDPVVRLETSCYALPRLAAPQSMLLLKSWTNGGFPDISQRLFGHTWTTPY
jgi:peptidoglycan/xylan/chitin deacetylase (PgdA/CDA1 family)